MIYIVEGEGLIPLPSNFLLMKPPSPIDYSISLEEGMLHMFYFIILTDGIIPNIVMQTLLKQFSEICIHILESLLLTPLCLCQ